LAGGYALRTCPWRQRLARVTALRVPSYEGDLAGLLAEAMQRWPATLARLRGARVLLKPNLVEHSDQRPVNTDPRLVTAAAEAFLRLGARSVRVGDGPGHRRDSEAVFEGSGLAEALRQVGVSCLDLNYDDAVSVELPGDRSGLGKLPIARAALQADLLVSMPKLKTHHWAGVTLSLKNLFGAVPGAELGWPKNPLHWAGIEECALDLWQALRPGFAIVDGVVGMEGDGPIMGQAVASGVVVLGEHLPAVDATCARLMGLRASRIRTLSMARGLGGTIAESRIEVEGDRVEGREFELLPQWGWLR